MSDTNSKINSPDPYGLAPIWDALMEIYDAFADLAERHGWRWYLVGGNALGAVRHNGDFIPWDDDLDLFMPRKDYAKLQKVANRELPPHLRWVDYHNTKSYPYLFGKIMDVRQEVHESLQRQTGRSFPQGLYVDIGPLDGCPTAFFRKAWRWMQRQTLRLAMEYHSTASSWKWHQIIRQPWPFLGACLRPSLRTNQDFLRAIDSHAQSLSMESAELCGMPIHRWYEFALVYPVQIYGNPQWVPFHGRKVPIPCDVTRYLKIEYGNWNDLPPDEQRRPSHEDLFVAPWKFGPDQG